MFYGGEGIVEVMQEGLPFLISRRGAEADGMVFERLPMDEQDISVGVLETAAEFVGDVTMHAGEDWDRPAEVCFKCGFPGRA
jgi:hypothetical protein